MEMEKKEEPNKANDSSMEVLASLDHFQTLIDAIQENHEETKKRLDYHKGSINQIDSKISSLEESSKIELLTFGIDAFSDSIEDYRQKLKRKIAIQKEATEKGRQSRNKSFLELLRQLNQSNEGRMVFDENKAMAIDTGTKLSSFLLDYFLFVRQTECTELKKKIEDVKDVIKSASLEENSTIINKFVSVIEFVRDEMGSSKMKRPKKKDAEKKDEKEEEKSFIKSGFDLLGMISFQILNLEIAFCHPFFQTSSAKREVLQEIAKYIRLLMAPKLEEISSYVKELQIRRRNKLKQELNVGIENLWKELDL